MKLKVPLVAGAPEISPLELSESWKAMLEGRKKGHLVHRCQKPTGSIKLSISIPRVVIGMVHDVVCRVWYSGFFTRSLRRPTPLPSSGLPVRNRLPSRARRFEFPIWGHYDFDSWLHSAVLTTTVPRCF